MRCLFDNSSVTIVDNQSDLSHLVSQAGNHQVPGKSAAPSSIITWTTRVIISVVLPAHRLQNAVLETPIACTLSKCRISHPLLHPSLPAQPLHAQPACCAAPHRPLPPPHTFSQKAALPQAGSSHSSRHRLLSAAGSTHTAQRSAGFDPLLGDAVDVAGIEQNFAGLDADYLVVRPIGLLQRLDRARVHLGRGAAELWDDHAAIGAVVVDVRRRHAHARQPRAVPLADVFRLQKAPTNEFSRSSGILRSTYLPTTYLSCLWAEPSGGHGTDG